MNQKISFDVSSLPEYTGVYLFKNGIGRVIYVGKALNLKKRITSYFKDNNDDVKKRRLVENIVDLELIEARNEFEALILEASLIKLYFPKFNISLKDDKQYLYVNITSEEYPRLLLSRKRSELDGELFGPFPSTQTAKTIIKYLRRIFPFCSQNPKIKKICFYSHLDLCFPCPAGIKKIHGEIRQKIRREYLKNIRNLRRILSGKIDSVVRELTREMLQKSAQKLFEEAALIRNKIRQLETVTREKFTPSEYMADRMLISNLRKKEQALLESELGIVFKKAIKAETIECYDVSNLSGKNAAGSMVTFYRGLPDKRRYRHFRIKTVKSPDDFAMLKEVLLRRLKHPEWRLPDLLVVDGGEQQLRIFSGVLNDLKINVPVVALAKKEERIYFARDEKTGVLDLARDSPALQLIQRLRDEAHRFAGRYHRLLRIKYLFNA